MLHKVGKVHFCLLRTTGFHIKAKNAGWHCHQNLKNENFLLSFGRPRKKIAPKACCKIIFHHSTSQIIDLWCSRCCCHCHFFNSLLMKGEAATSGYPCSIFSLIRFTTFCPFSLLDSHKIRKFSLIYGDQ